MKPNYLEELERVRLDKHAKRSARFLKRLERRALWWGMSVVIVAGLAVGYWLASLFGWLI